MIETLSGSPWWPDQKIWVTELINRNPKILHFYRLTFWVHRSQFQQHFDVGILFYKHLTLKGYFLWKNQVFVNFCSILVMWRNYLPHPLQEGFVPVLLRLNSSQGPTSGAIISSPPSTHLKEKTRFFKTSYYLLSWI